MRKLLLATMAAMIVAGPLAFSAKADDVTVKERDERAVIKDRVERTDDNTVIEDRVGPPNDVVITGHAGPRRDDRLIMKDR
jgi:Ni/Co efflux regulator RcnB